MRPYSPGGVLTALATAPRGSLPPTPSTHRLRRGLPGYLILFAPHAVAPQRQQRPSWPPSPRCSSRSLRIPPLHREFHQPLPCSSPAVSKAVLRLSRSVSPPTYQAAYAPFTPSDSGQRLHPLYYRGCWHRVSRCFLWRYRQNFVPPDSGLQPEGRHPTRGVAASGFRPLRNIPHCCLP